MSLRALGLSVAALALSLTARAQAPTALAPSDAALRTLDRAAERILAEHRAPGAVLALASGGEILALRAYGLAHVELGVPVTDSTVFEIGSISKSFLAAAVLQQVQEGALSLDSPARRWLDLPEAWGAPTVRHLLTHTSGIPDYEAVATYNVYREVLSVDDIVGIAATRAPDFAPGTGWAYSNTGYVLLSRIVETVDGAPLGDVLQRRLFGPLGMTQTGMTDPWRLVPGRAAGYWVDASGALVNRPPTEPSSTLGAGGILSTAADLARWDAALRGDAVLTEASKRVMWTPARLDDGSPARSRSGRRVAYGLGWFLSPLGGLRAQHHSGQVAGFSAYVARFPEPDVAVIVLTNLYDWRAGARALREAAFEAFVPGYGT